MVVTQVTRPCPLPSPTQLLRKGRECSESQGNPRPEYSADACSPPCWAPKVLELLLRGGIGGGPLQDSHSLERS